MISLHNQAWTSLAYGTESTHGSAYGPIAYAAAPTGLWHTRQRLQAYGTHGSAHWPMAHAAAPKGPQAYHAICPDIDFAVDLLLRI